MAAGTGDLNTIADLLAAALTDCVDSGWTILPRGHTAEQCLPVINIRPIEGDRGGRGNCSAQFVITAYADAECGDPYTDIYTVMSPCTDGSILKCLREGRATMLAAGYDVKFDSPRNFGRTAWNSDTNNAYAAQVVVTVTYCCCDANPCFGG
jgi:hypothetical protein